MSFIVQVYAKRGKGWSPSGPVPSRVVQTVLNGKVADEKDQTKEKFFGTFHCLELWHGTSCRKMRLEILRIVFSSTGGHTMHGRSPSTSGPLWNNRRTVLKCLYMSRIGRPDLLQKQHGTMFVTKGCWDWESTSIKPKTSGNSAVWDIRLKIANLVHSKMRHLQVTCRIQKQRQDLYCAHLDRTRLFPLRGCARSKPQFLTAVPNLKLIRLTQVYVWMVGNIIPVCQPRGTLSVTNATESFRLIHILTIVYLSPLTTFRPTFPTAHTQPNSTLFEDNAAPLQMTNKGRSSNLRHVTGTHRVDSDWLLQPVSLDHSMLIKYVRTNDQLADILTRWMFTTMQWHSFLSLLQIRRPFEPSDVRTVSRKPFSCSALAKPQAMSQVMTQTESVDQMWRQYSSKVLKSGCILGDCGTLEQLSNNELKLYARQEESSCRNVLRPESEGKPFASRYFISDLEKTKDLWDLVSSTENCRKCKGQKFTSSQIQFYVWENKRCTGQNSSSFKDGMIISSNTGNPQGELMENRFNSYSTCVFAVNERDSAQDRWMHSSRSRRRWTPSSPSYFHVKNERNSDFFKGTERRWCAISARRGKKCSLPRAVQAWILNAQWSKVLKKIELLLISKNIQITQKGKGMNWENKLRMCILKGCNRFQEGDSKRGGENMHFSASDLSIKMMMDLISSANDFVVAFGTCDCLGQIYEIDWPWKWTKYGSSWSHSKSLGDRPSPCLDLVQLTTSQVVLRQQRETSGYFGIYKQQKQLAKQRTQRQTKNSFDCKIAEYAQNLEDRGTPSNKACKKQRWKAQHILRRSWQTIQCWKNLSQKQKWTDQRNTYFQQNRKREHWCESTKHEQPWGIDVGNCVYRRSSKLSSDGGNWQKIKAMRHQKAQGNL